MSVDKNVMASFGQGFVQTQIISENNAVKYKLDLAGSNKNSTKTAFCTINDVAIGSQTFNVGLNTRLMNEAGTLIESKYFDIKNSPGAPQAYIDYINGLAANQVLLIISNSEIGSTTAIDTLMNKIASSSWPGTNLLTMFPTSSYSAIYLTTEKAICKESVCMNDGVLKEDSNAYLMGVFDKMTDIGATGFVRRLVNDGATYSSTSTYEFKRFPTDALVTPLPELGSASRIMYFGAELYASKALLDEGLTTRITLRWLNGTNVVSSTSFEVATNQPNGWVKKSSRVTVPDNANGYTIIASRYPSSATAVGEGRVRNVVLGRISRQFENLSRASEIGVNGIRMNDLYEDSSDYDLELTDTNTDPSGAVYGQEFREFQRF